MNKHGTVSQQVAGWYVEFQMTVLRALPRDINQEIADGLRNNGEALAKVFRDALMPDAKTDKFSKVISPSLVIGATDGKEILADADDVFAYIDSDFRNWKADEPGQMTEETKVRVREMSNNATFSQVFGELSNDVRKLCLDQSQIKSFVKNNRGWLHPDGWAMFFLFELYGNFFVAGVCVGSGGGLGVSVRRFETSRVWLAEDRRRLVVPQLA